jgi:hypothetical protein
MTLQTPNLDRKIVYTEKADLSSGSSACNVVIPDNTPVMEEEALLTDARVIMQDVVVAEAAQPPARKYAVLRGRRSTLQQEPENEPRTRSVERNGSFGLPRIGFTKLNTR